MKQIIFSLALLVGTVAYGQNNNNNHNNNDRNRVPNSVEENFKKDHPDAGDAKWSQRNGQWHAKYRDNNSRDVDSYYDRTGKHMDTYIAWDRKDVPPDLDRTIYRRYHSHHYTAYRVERPGADVLFQIKIGGGKVVYLDEKGREKRYYGHH